MAWHSETVDFIVWLKHVLLANKLEQAFTFVNRLVSLISIALFSCNYCERHQIRRRLKYDKILTRTKNDSNESRNDDSWWHLAKWIGSSEFRWLYAYAKFKSFGLQFEYKTAAIEMAAEHFDF